jgi:undecaprenyl-diphosphatase
VPRVNLIQAVVLGFVQGITEFLPVSSSAHLRIVPALFGWPDAGAAYTAVLQLGTLVAVIGFFLRDLLSMLAAVLDPARRNGPEARRLLYIIVGTIPLMVAGVLFKHAIEGPLRSLTVIATMMIVVGLLLGLTEKLASHRRGIDEMTMRDALLIGCAQALALIPGTSRSGITLVAALGLGLRRESAARFSFLLSVPAVAAAAIYELPKALRTPNLAGAPLLVGVLVAAVFGYLSIAWLLRFLRTRTTIPFVVYRVAMGAALLLAIARGWLPNAEPPRERISVRIATHPPGHVE